MLQIATAVYYIALDVITMSQYLFYVIRNQGCRGEAASTIVTFKLHSTHIAHASEAATSDIQILIHV